MKLHFSYHLTQITEMKTIIGNLKTNLIEKEGVLDEYETLIKRLRREQDDLHRELDEQKTKNNVRRHFLFLLISLGHFLM